MVAKTSIGIVANDTETKLIEKLSVLLEAFSRSIDAMEKAESGASSIADQIELANYYRNAVIPAMDAVREISDEMETMTAKKYWPFPTYSELLFGV